MASSIELTNNKGVNLVRGYELSTLLNNYLILNLAYYGYVRVNL